MEKKKTKTAEAVRPGTVGADVGVPFPVVGIGASAGGLEALEQFLEHVPVESGMAFVIVQHLDPTRKGILAALLQRVTGMQVVQVRSRTKIRPNRVYVIPPNKDMSMRHGGLHLTVPKAPRGLRLPVDIFLQSLAGEQGNLGVGVILSGMGVDGTHGLQAIKEHAGVAVVQDPETAKFDSMPRSAIDAGLADIVAPAGELPEKIIAALRHSPIVVGSSEPMAGQAGNALDKVIALLRARTGHDFSCYKRNTIYRRIERRMGLHQIGDIATYVCYLQDNEQERDLLFNELLIGVTRFFRDAAAWVSFAEQEAPVLLASRPPGQAALRAWVPGCSTGEEAYSLAMTLKEAVDAAGPDRPFTIRVFATDLDRDAIDKARQGFFPARIAADLSPARLKRFFSREEHGYRVRKEIREMVVFATQDLTQDPPFTKLDILSCRNLLIYLTPEIQKKLIPLFHYSLNPGGVLFLGSAETTGGFTDLFTPINGKSRLFRRREAALRGDTAVFPLSFVAGSAVGTEKRLPPTPAGSLQTLADQLVLQRYAPPAVLTNDKGDILYVSGRTGNYLEPAAGKANWNVFAMAREGLRYALASAFQKALDQEEGVALHALRAEANGDSRLVDVNVQRLDEPGPLQGLVMILFIDRAVSPRQSGRRPAAHTGHTRIESLKEELVRSRAAEQVNREEMQMAQEDLRSTNEELQSANEELMTSKEEMQSMNEELQTLNAELQGRLDELSQAGSDMKNLLDSTDIATLFLDRELHVRRYTPTAATIIKLIPGDVGRPITDLASDLNYPELAADARTVLQTLASMEKPVNARDNRWFSVRVMPYRTSDDRIDGVIITFTDITPAKTLEAKLRDRQTALESHVVKQDLQLVKSRRKP